MCTKKAEETLLVFGDVIEQQLLFDKLLCIFYSGE